ncbi:MAG: CARDB domain-containing protein [Thermoanaerobaculia bacterium]|nr:CARDB domain-containing protein [Thermoanaerobaculia bacterium]
MRRLLLALLTLVIAACGSPDLTGERLDIPERIVPGDELEGEVVVVNRGGAEAVSADDFFHLDWALSSDTALPPGPLTGSSGYADDALLAGGRDQVDTPIAAGATATTGAVSSQVPSNTPPGEHYVCVLIDSFGHVDESDEANNVICAAVEVEAEFCLDFEEGLFPATDGADATALYASMGVRFPSGPRIFRQPPLFDEFQGLYQGDPGAARPETSCGPLEIAFDASLDLARVRFEARNIGFIDPPVGVTATALAADGSEIDRRSFVSRSRPGDLATFEVVGVESLPADPDADPPRPEDPPIARVLLEYATCLPHVAIDNLCVEPKRPEETG